MAKKKRQVRDEERRRAAFAASQRRLTRRRTVVGALGFIPLAATLVPCGAAGPLDLLCAVPREWWLVIWAAAFGSFLGLTIRLILERRRFTRGAWRERSA